MVLLFFFCWIGALISISKAQRLELDVPLCTACSKRWRVARRLFTLSIVGLVASLLAPMALYKRDDDLTAIIGGMVLSGAALLVMWSFMHAQQCTIQFKGETGGKFRLAGVNPRAAQIVVTSVA